MAARRRLVEREEVVTGEELDEVLGLGVSQVLEVSRGLVLVL